MSLLLTYFNRKLGPELFLSVPEELSEKLDPETIQKVVSLLESNDEGFFIHNFSEEFRTANYIFKINSNYARARQEILLISIIVSEKEPNYSYYEKVLTTLVRKLTNYESVYKSFYVSNLNESTDSEESQQLSLLKEELVNAYKIISVKQIETTGFLFSKDYLFDRKAIPLKIDALNKIVGLKPSEFNYFVVYRSQGKSFKIEIIPVETDQIVQLTIIFGDQMMLKIIQEITRTFSEYDKEIKLVFTTGICEEGDRCIYEVYIQTDINEFSGILKDIHSIEGVLEINVNLIDLER